MNRRAGDKVGDLCGIDAIARAYFRGSDTRQFAGSNGLYDGRPAGGELIAVAVTTCHDARSAKALFARDGGREKIIGFIAGSLGAREAAGGHEPRQDIQLLD